MTYPENTPQWLKEARISADAKFEIKLGIFGYYVVWIYGEWRGGEWQGGEWRGGVWQGGVWQGGVWQGGEWQGGEWQGGEWQGGLSTCRSKYIPLLLDNGNIKIGCKEKSIKEWDKWFKGKEEFSTPRGTLEFKMIFAHYKAMKAYVEEMKK